MTTRRASKQPTSVHQLHVTLRDIQPPIWRRIVVPSDFTLAELHDVLQEVVGWHHSHLHDFRVGKVTYGDPDLLQDLADQDEREARLGEIAPKPRKRFQYTYDFGDNWELDVLVEAVGLPEPGIRYPSCLAGERAGPPDDSGGIWRYAYLVEAMADHDSPDREELEEFLEWLDEPFDPEAFDLKSVNKRLRRYVR